MHRHVYARASHSKPGESKAPVSPCLMWAEVKQDSSAPSRCNPGLQAHVHYSCFSPIQPQALLYPERTGEEWHHQVPFLPPSTPPWPDPGPPFRPAQCWRLALMQDRATSLQLNSACMPYGCSPLQTLPNAPSAMIEGHWCMHVLAIPCGACLGFALRP